MEDQEYETTELAFEHGPVARVVEYIYIYIYMYL